MSKGTLDAFFGPTIVKKLDNGIFIEERCSNPKCRKILGAKEPKYTIRLKDKEKAPRCDPNGYLYVSAVWPVGAAVDVIDRWPRQLGQIDVARVLGAALAPANPVIVGVYDALANRMPAMDNVGRPGYQDIIDRLARLLGQVDLAFYRGVACGAVNPLDVQIIVGGVVIDPRQIRPLVAADILTVNNLLNPHPISGSVTANAGLNLNTSLLALEAGGNLATIAIKDFATQTTLALIKAKTDNIDVLLSTVATKTTLDLVNAKLVSGTDIGDVTINNGAGAAAVNVQDGGNSLTVDGAVTVSGTLTQSTKHDAKVYLSTANGSAADGATVISNVANKVIKIHRLFLQSTVDGATDVYLYEETSGNLVTTKTTMNAREGRESAFVPAPACIGQTTTQDKKVLLKNAATKQVNWEITYSADDAS